MAAISAATWPGWTSNVARTCGPGRRCLESDDDAVRAMTIHGAKGLEFPVVFLAGLDRCPSNRPGVRVLWGDDGPELKIKSGVGTRGYAELEAREKVMEDAEDLRLLYVAATRARDYLIVSLHHKAGSPCHAAQLLAGSTARPELSHWLEPATDPSDAPFVSGPEAGGPGDDRLLPAATIDTEERRAEWNAAHRRLVTTGSRSRTLSATAIAGLANGAGQDDPGGEAPSADAEGAAGASKDEPDVDPPPWRRGRAGTAIGRAVHAVLQTVDLASGSDVDRLSEAQAVAEGVPGPREGDRPAGAGRPGSEIIGEAVGGGRYWREMYIGVPATDEPGGPVIEGIIDLLIETPEGFAVVDYKTDAVRNDEDLAHAADRYRLQGATYSLAVERTLGRPVTRCTFLFLRESTAIPFDVPDLPVAMQEVEGLVCALAGEPQGRAQ